MKIVRSNAMQFIAASHEDPSRPGALKRVLFKKGDFIEGHVQMVNWAKIPVGQGFAAHYHEDMQELFVIVSGRARIKIKDEGREEEEELGAGDGVLVPVRSVHSMLNVGEEDVVYLVVGVSAGEGGKTVVV